MVLKVKLWDKVAQKMIPYDENRNLEIKNGQEALVGIGAVDLNGKEIFEGDILKCSEIIGFVEYDSKTSGFVLWVKNNETASFSFLRAAGHWNEWCITGNKYENIELLEFDK